MYNTIARTIYDRTTTNGSNRALLEAILEWKDSYRCHSLQQSSFLPVRHSVGLPRSPHKTKHSLSCRVDSKSARSTHTSGSICGKGSERLVVEVETHHQVVRGYSCGVVGGLIFSIHCSSAISFVSKSSQNFFNVYCFHADVVSP